MHGKNRVVAMHPLTMKDKLIKETSFPAKHFTTLKSAGNMKDDRVRSSFLISQNLNPENLVLARQVHGAGVCAVTSADKGKIIENCDALITSDKDVLLGIFTADCMPVLMVCENGAKAAVHAGWKGLAAGIIENTLKALEKEFGANPAEITVYIAPHIQECCYEVSRDFEKVFKKPLKNGRFSLGDTAAEILKKNGVRKVFVSPDCTMHNKDLFFSYRRDKAEERQMTIVTAIKN